MELLEVSSNSNSNDKEDPGVEESIVSSESSENIPKEHECCCNEYNKHLETRISALAETLKVLKHQLHEERELWRRELEVRKENYALHPFPVFYDYEHDMQRYQEAMMQSQYETRQILQKQMAFSNYKRRLLEVENMCNLELMRVKQSVQILQPLQMMASEWERDNCGDSKKLEEMSKGEEGKEDTPKSESSLAGEKVYSAGDAGLTNAKKKLTNNADETQDSGTN